MDHQQTVKIDNYKEQYNSILSNISEKNKDLETVLEEVLKATVTLDSTRDTLSKSERNLETLRLQSDDIEKGQQRADQKLNEKEADLNRFEKELALEKQIIAGKKTERELEEDSYVEAKQSEGRNLEDKILKLNVIVSREQDELKTMVNTKDTLIETISELRKEKNTQDVILTEQIKGLEETKIVRSKEVDAIDREIEELNKKVSEAIEKQRLPNRLLAERETRIKEKEANLEILVGRWRKFHGELFPGQEMKL